MEAFVDSATLVDIYRAHPPALNWARMNAHRKMGISSIVWLEMMRGAKDKGDQRVVMQFVSAFELEYLTQDDQYWAMKQFQIYHLSHGVGLLDCLIAAPAHRLQLPLYTRNLKHFESLLGGLAVVVY